MVKELTKEEEIKLGNFGEQFASIRKNVEVANEELEGILKAIDKESAAFQYNQEEHARAMEVLGIERTLTEKYIADERKLLEYDIAKLKIERETFNTEKEEALAFIEAEQNEIKHQLNQVGDLQKKIAELTQDVAVLGGTIISLTDREAALEISIAYLKAEIMSTDREFLLSRQNRDEMITLANKDIKAKQVELLEAEEAVRVEMAKMVVPQQSIDAQFAELDKEKRDMEIMYFRTMRTLERLKPGLSLDDILKNKNK